MTVSSPLLILIMIGLILYWIGTYTKKSYRPRRR
jgi:hypothetical protein